MLVLENLGLRFPRLADGGLTRLSPSASTSDTTLSLMPYCDCPALCKGGKNVSERTYRSHAQYRTSRLSDAFNNFIAAEATRQPYRRPGINAARAASARQRQPNAADIIMEEQHEMVEPDRAGVFDAAAVDLESDVSMSYFTDISIALTGNL